MAVLFLSCNFSSWYLFIFIIFFGHEIKIVVVVVVAVGLPGGQMCMHLIIFSFLCEQTFLIAFHLRLQLRFLMRQCGTTCFCIYCTKNTSVDP